MSIKRLVFGAGILAFTASSALAATITLTTTIRVTSGTFSCGGNTYISNGSGGLGDGGQGESQSPLFRVENGATLDNCVIGAPAADGVHFYNGGRANNIRWTDVGEDAATVKSSNNSTVTISGGSTRQSADKTFQVNAAGTFNVTGHDGDGFQTFIRQNGGTSYCVTINLNNSNIRNGRRGVYTNSTCSRINVSGTTFTNVTNHVQINSTVISGSGGGGGSTPTPTATPRATPTSGGTPTPTSGGGTGSLSAPSGLSATGGSRQITLRWTDNSGNESGFRIERSTGGSFSEKATVGANTTTWTNTGLTSGNVYSYRVRAYNGSGTSAYSNTATATVQ